MMLILLIFQVPIKEPNDYNIFLSFLKAQKFSLDEKNLVGIVGSPTSIVNFKRVFVGLENFIYHEMDEPELIKTVLDAMSENCYKQYKLIAKNSPCDVILFWDDANSLYLCLDMFEQYSVPVMQRYAEIAHRYGKTLVCHTCGNINSFLEIFLQAGIDAGDWVAPSQ